MNELVKSLGRLYRNEHLSDAKKEKIEKQTESLLAEKKITVSDYNYILRKENGHE